MTVAEWIVRWSWLGRSVVYFGWFGWIGLLVLGGGRYDFWNTPFAADHLAFYTAGEMILHGQADKVYAWEPHVRARQQEILPEHWKSMVAFRNPPFYALLYVPTAILPYFWSAIVWEFVSFVALVFSIIWLQPRSPRVALVHALGFFPVLCTLMYGQNTLLSLGLFALTYHHLRRGHSLQAGLVAGFLVYKPTLLLGLVLWGILDFRRRWPCAVGICITTAGLCLGSYLLVPETWAGFVQTFRANLAYDETCLEWWKNIVPEAFFRVLLPELSPDAIRFMTLLSALLGIAWFVLIYRAQKDNMPVVFGAAVVVSLWINKHALIYEWALLIIPGVLWREHSGHDRRVWVIPFFWAWIGLLVSVDFSWFQIWLWRRYLPEIPEHTLMVSIPALAYAGYQSARILLSPVKKPDQPAVPG